jgi:transposase
LFVEFLPQGKTMKKLCLAIQNKVQGMLTRRLVLLDDNARPRTAAQTQALIASFGWEQFHRSPYSPDLAPSDFYLFCN